MVIAVASPLTICAVSDTTQQGVWLPYMCLEELDHSGVVCQTNKVLLTQHEEDKSESTALIAGVAGGGSLLLAAIAGFFAHQRRVKVVTKQARREVISEWTDKLTRTTNIDIPPPAVGVHLEVPRGTLTLSNCSVSYLIRCILANNPVRDVCCR